MKQDGYPGQCFVYLICGDGEDALFGPCKIGISDSPEKRLKQVQTGNPNKLTLAFTFRVWDRKFAKMVETSFHDGHAAHRLNGEWFDLRPTDALRGLVDVFKIGFDRIFKDEPNRDELFQSTAEACNLMEAANLLCRIYEAEGTLLTQAPPSEAIN